MRRNIGPRALELAIALLCVAAAGMQAGCSGQSTPPVVTAPAVEAPTAAADARTAELTAREQELSRREADLATKDHEREAAEQQAREQRETAARTAAAKKARLARATQRAEREDRRASATAPAAAPVSIPLIVPAGTLITVALASDLSSKTAKPGDTFETRLVSDLMINNRRAVTAGSRVSGTITDVISGSNAIGGTPMLGLRFDHLQMNNGEQIAISGELKEQGNSEKGQDAAKILGGAAAGAVLGHQVKHGSGGQIIGGLLGGAIGAVAAKKTGTEVVLVAGSTLTIALGQSFTVANL